MKKIGIIEVFMPIDEFPNYEVSNYGNVRNKMTGRILSPRKNSRGYYSVNLSDNNFKVYSKAVHRLVLVAFENNSENKKCVDHIDNDKSNNCHQQNSRNSSLSSRNTSGFKGISSNKQNNKWSTYIIFNSKKLHLGFFDNLEDAKQARKNKAIELFGDYINKCEL